MTHIGRAQMSSNIIFWQKYSRRRFPTVCFLLILLSLLGLSCGITGATSNVLDWSDSLATAPIRIITTSGKSSVHDINHIDFSNPQDMEELCIRLVDSKGRVFRLPRDMHATWTLMGGSGDGRQFSLNAYNETGQPPSIGTPTGYVEGQCLYIIPSRPREGYQYSIQVSLRVSPDRVFEKSISIGLRYPLTRQ